MPAGCKMMNLKIQENNNNNNIVSLKSPEKGETILESYEEALAIAKDCLEQISDNIVSPKKYDLGSYIALPDEVNDGVWEQSIDAAQRTLEYIFNVLHHSCYMLAVNGGKSTLYKLKTSGIPEYYKEEIREAARKNPAFSEYVTKLDELRILQCIVKSRGKEEGMSVEYKRFFEEFGNVLPNGVYILNLTDAVLFRKDKLTPWGESNPLLEGKLLPILGGSGAVGFHDIPIPNYDDIRIVLGYAKLDKYETDWSKKKDKAVFRGSPSGCGTTAETNMRIRIAEMKMDPKLLDAGITRVGAGIPRFDPVVGMSILQTSAKKIGFMTLVDQSKHKYMVHIDGNVAAYRLLQSMMTGSVILKVKGRYTLWVDHLLQDGVHYVGVNEDLSDLEEKIRWCIDHDKECEEMAKRSYEFAKEMLTRERVESVFTTLLWSVYEQSHPVVNSVNERVMRHIFSNKGGHRYKKSRRVEKHKRRTTKRRLRR